MKKTTLLIYIAADNNLKKAGKKDLESIREVSKDIKEINIVVQLDTKESGSRHYFIDGKEEIEELDVFNSGDYRILKRFIEESSLKYPSKQLIVIIWGHGSGIDDGNPYDAQGNKKLEKTSRAKIFELREDSKKLELIGIGYDDTKRDFIDNIQLKEALNTSVKIDIVGFDACLMGMFEIAYQLREQVSFMVGSQYIEPSTGWPYKEIINDIKSKNTLKKIASDIVKAYHTSYVEGYKNVTQSAYDCSIAEKIAQNLDSFAKKIKSSVTKNELKEILKGIQDFKRDDYLDLVHFVNKINEKFPFQETKILLNSLEMMIIDSLTVGKYMDNANGVSIYFPYRHTPNKETFEMYQKLDFSKDYPSWVELIEWYHE